MNYLEQNSNIETIKHIDDDGYEYWLASELMNLLDYKEWKSFEKVIKKAKIACNTCSSDILDHFISIDKMVDIGSNTKRKIKDYKLSRYACYLIVMNADSKIETVALCKSYIACQTRKMELFEENIDDGLELATNMFINTMVEQKARNENIFSKKEIDNARYEVEKVVRETFK